MKRSAIQRALSEMFGEAKVAVETSEPALMLQALSPEEREYISTASLKRQGEFSTARVCARTALERLTFPAVGLVPQADRSPRWPAGAVGSISHTDGLCAVVVASKTTFTSIGVDVETDRPIDSNLERLICTSAESEWLDTQERNQRGRWRKVLFSAKESFYKCQYPETKMFLDFRDIQIEPDVGRATFGISALVPYVPPYLLVGQGRWAFVEHYIVTAYYVRPITTRYQRTQKE